MHWAIIDTSVYIDHWEHGTHDDLLAAVRRAFVVRHSSVVLSELRRGARTPDARRLVGALFKLARIQWAPAGPDWWEAGRLVRTIGDAEDWDRHRRRAFQNDALIALTGRRYGATIVTSDRADFDRLRREVRVAVLSI